MVEPETCMKRHYHLVLLTTLLLSACGFQLRGSTGLSAEAISSIHVQSPPDSSIATELRSQLQMAGATLAASSEQAGYILVLNNEQYRRSVLSVSPASGKVEEYQMSLGINMTLSAVTTRALIASERISAVRDYTFDENAALAMFTQEAMLREDLSRQIASSIIRRLSAAVESR
jgi:LPS-assembly lipoprotein